MRYSPCLSLLLLELVSISWQHPMNQPWQIRTSNSGQYYRAGVEPYEMNDGPPLDRTPRPGAYLLARQYSRPYHSGGNYAAAQHDYQSQQRAQGSGAFTNSNPYQSMYFSQIEKVLISNSILPDWIANLPPDDCNKIISILFENKEYTGELKPIFEYFAQHGKTSNDISEIKKCRKRNYKRKSRRVARIKNELIGAVDYEYIHSSLPESSVGPVIEWLTAAGVNFAQVTACKNPQEIADQTLPLLFNPDDKYDSRRLRAMNRFMGATLKATEDFVEAMDTFRSRELGKTIEELSEPRKGSWWIPTKEDIRNAKKSYETRMQATEGDQVGRDAGSGSASASAPASGSGAASRGESGSYMSSYQQTVVDPAEEPMGVPSVILPNQNHNTYLYGQHQSDDLMHIQLFADPNRAATGLYGFDPFSSHSFTPMPSGLPVYPDPPVHLNAPSNYLYAFQHYSDSVPAYNDPVHYNDTPTLLNAPPGDGLPSLPPTFYDQNEDWSDSYATQFGSSGRSSSSFLFD